MTDFDRVKEINRLSKIIVESTEDDFIDEFYELSRGKIRFFEDILVEIQDLLDYSFNELYRREL